MSSYSPDDAIKRFLELARHWNDESATARTVVNEFWQFCAEVKVTGVPVDEVGADELNIFLGPFPEMGIGKVADCRSLEIECDWSSGQFLTLNLTRTLNPEDGDFDDDAYNMTVLLYFGDSNESPPASIDEVTDARLAEYLAKDAVGEILDVTPRKFAAFVSAAG